MAGGYSVIWTNFTLVTVDVALQRYIYIRRIITMGFNHFTNKEVAILSFFGFSTLDQDLAVIPVYQVQCSKSSSRDKFNESILVSLIVH